MEYQVKQLISTEQRHTLLDMFHDGKHRYATQDYNLHDVTKVDIRTTDKNKDAFKLLDEFAAKQPGVGEPYAHYFLHYGRGSFTKTHSDNDEAIGLTIVTMLEHTPNLVGGDTIVTLPYKGPVRDDGYIKGEPHIDQRMIMRVVSMDEGDSISYDRSLMHAVSQVEIGHRIVLVSWYKSTNV
jgi:predicted 2-oxoglutarate/Fe(II)-dependent dioxygenase YbiX